MRTRHTLPGQASAARLATRLHTAAHCYTRSTLSSPLRCLRCLRFRQQHLCGRPLRDASGHCFCFRCSVRSADDPLTDEDFQELTDEDDDEDDDHYDAYDAYDAEPEQDSDQEDGEMADEQEVSEHEQV